MVEKPIKVDEHTDRIVTDLAHFLRSTKKAVVRDAVAEHAESRHALMAIGAGGGPTVADAPCQSRIPSDPTFCQSG